MAKPFTLEEFDNIATKMGFERKSIPKCWEWVYDGAVRTTTREFPYIVRIYSSIDIQTGEPRRHDTVRLVLFYVDKRAHMRVITHANRVVARTKNCLPRVINQTRDLFKTVIKGKCPACGDQHGGVMAPREGRNGWFLGCTRWPVCNATMALPNTSREKEEAEWRNRNYYGPDNPRPEVDHGVR